MANILEGNNLLDVQMVRITGNLMGTVTDADTSQPLADVKITIGGLEVFTNAQGAYAFEDMTPGTYAITFEKTGYTTETR